MSELPELQGPIDQSIHTEALKNLPRDWTKTVLEVSIVSEGTDGTELSIRLDPCGQHGIALASDALQERVRELFLLNARFQTELQRIRRRYTLDPADGRWNFEGEYGYP